jgi:formate hydrogenlyase transcriptional activator
MKSATRSLAQELPNVEREQNELGRFSSESVLNILNLILAGSELCEVLAIIARLVESQGNNTLCTIWLPDPDGKHVYCAAAPSLAGFAASAGRMSIGPKGASCGTAIYRREPVYVADILREPIWDDYRDRVLPYGYSCRLVAPPVHA